MICYFFKGVTGSSRVVKGLDRWGGGQMERDYTVGVLGQPNYGKRNALRIGGAPVGKFLHEEALKAAEEELEDEKVRKDGSMIVVTAMDVSLYPV